MPFELLTFPADYRQSARFDESLITMAAENGPVACLWQAEQGLVVPRTYQRYDGFTAACEQSARQSWPVTVRLSGGGIVPQGPGIINLSLAYAVQGLPLAHSDAAYELICGIIQRALNEHGIATRPGAVEGAFCDGRYNLVFGAPGSEKKVAGTAQLWRRIKTNPPERSEPPTGTAQIVLAHALILAAIDARSITQRANLFEQAIGHDKQYDPARIASLYECRATTTDYSAAEFTTDLGRSLIAQLNTTNAAQAPDAELRRRGPVF